MYRGQMMWVADLQRTAFIHSDKFSLVEQQGSTWAEIHIKTAYCDPISLHKNAQRVLEACVTQETCTQCVIEQLSYWSSSVFQPAEEAELNPIHSWEATSCVSW